MPHNGYKMILCMQVSKHRRHLHSLH